MQDNVCTHILHLQNRKLKTYRGNLSEFVKKVPEAKSYYELSAAQVTFRCVSSVLPLDLLVWCLQMRDARVAR
jgi:hypothetical protein